MSQNDFEISKILQNLGMKSESRHWVNEFQSEEKDWNKDFSSPGRLYPAEAYLILKWISLDQIRS